MDVVVTLTLLSLPGDVLNLIFGSLDTVSKLRLVRVCRALHNRFRLSFRDQFEARCELASRYRYKCRVCDRTPNQCACDQPKPIRYYAECLKPEFWGCGGRYDPGPVDCEDCENCRGLWLPNGDEFEQFHKDVKYDGHDCDLVRTFLPYGYEEEYYESISHAKLISVRTRYDADGLIIIETEQFEHMRRSCMYSTDNDPVYDHLGEPIHSNQVVEYYRPDASSTRGHNWCDILHSTKTDFYYDGSSAMYVYVDNKLVRSILKENGRRVSVIDKNGYERIENGPKQVEIDGPYCITW